MKLLNRLIEQAKNPNGRIGSIMLRIMNKAHAGMNAWAFERLDLAGNPAILDIGCGGGKTLHTLSELNPNAILYGVDSSEQAVKDSLQANQKAAEAGRVRVFQAFVSDTPFEDRRFDLITAFQTHYFWDDMEGAVKEVFRILKEKGCFTLVAELYKINYHMTSYKTKEDMRSLLVRTGFHTVTFHEQAAKGWLCIQATK
ncbi:class I SAM-dependent methyltransferase [Paenibacillus sp. CN-4]|uniref:class I SAM-dependent methyltransferase n=1 Tax=Paenibacillus nanchangensis TaxID=3348343 RepID=UPI00397C03DF